MVYSTTFNFKICELTLTSDGENLTAILFGNTHSIGAVKNDNLAIFKTTKTWLTEYLSGRNPTSKQPALALSGTPFQLAVWEELKRIPYGQTISYGEIAKNVAKKLDKQKMSAQAVGGAVGHNPIPIIMPCHRVVGADNKLTGFHGGLEIKKFLLKKENVDLTKFKD